MKDKYKILVAGGDMRQVYCALRLSEEYDTSIIGFDDEFIGDDISIKSAVLSEGESFDCIVLPVIPIEENGMLNSPCSAVSIDPLSISRILRPGGVIFAGKVDERLRKIFPGYEICDYLVREELSLKNAIPTAEGAVQLALEELPVTLNGLSVLIVGMGRIGTALAEILKGFGADVTAAVRNESGAAKARIHGIKSVYTAKAGSDYGLVFNTVPSLVFDKEKLSAFGAKTLFIDLASKPGGIDFEAASELGIKAIWALGLPGKTAPVTSGEIIAESILEVLGERSGGDV